LEAARPIADRNVLFAAIEHQADGRTGFAREVDGEHTEVANAVLGAESAAGEIADHPDFAPGQIEDVGGLVADAGSELGRGVDGQAVLAPVGDNAVRLHRDMGLDLGAVLAVDNNVGLSQSLLNVAAWPAKPAALIGPADVPPLRQAWRRAAPARRCGLLSRAREDRWRTFLHRFVERGNVGQWLVDNFDEPCRGLGRTRGFRCHRRQRLAGIAHGGIAMLCLRPPVAQLRQAEGALQHVHRAHARVLLGRRGVDGGDTRMRHVTDDPARV
jgi:hypothetical protein